MLRGQVWRPVLCPNDPSILEDILAAFDIVNRNGRRGSWNELLGTLKAQPGPAHIHYIDYVGGVVRLNAGFHAPAGDSGMAALVDHVC